MNLLYIGEVVGARRADDLTPIHLDTDPHGQRAEIELRPDAPAWPSLTRVTAVWAPEHGWRLTLHFQQAKPLQWHYDDGADRPGATELAHWVGLVLAAPEFTPTATLTAKRAAGPANFGPDHAGAGTELRTGDPE